MPFKTINVQEMIDLKLKNDPDFRKAWNRAKFKYKVLGNLIYIKNRALHKRNQ